MSIPSRVRYPYSRRRLSGTAGSATPVSTRTVPFATPSLGPCMLISRFRSPTLVQKGGGGGGSYVFLFTTHISGVKPFGTSIPYVSSYSAARWGSHKFFCIGFCLACSVCQSGFRGLPQDMAVPSRYLRRDFPKKVKSIFSYGIARPLENRLRMNFDALTEFRETPDYHKNCSPECTSDSYSYAFCRSKLILLLLTRARRDATPPIVPDCILIRYRTVRIYRKKHLLY